MFLSKLSHAKVTHARKKTEYIILIFVPSLLCFLKKYIIYQVTQKGIYLSARKRLRIYLYLLTFICFSAISVFIFVINIARYIKRIIRNFDAVASAEYLQSRSFRAAAWRNRDECENDRPRYYTTDRRTIEE